MIERREKAAAYQVSLSAVKNTQKLKRGIDKAKQAIPEIVAHRPSFLKIKKTKATKNARS